MQEITEEFKAMGISNFGSGFKNQEPEFFD
jgi:hypothetical protein